MNKSLFLFSVFISLVTNTLFSQSSFNNGGNRRSFNNIKNDTLNNSGEIKVTLSGKTKYTDYKVFSHE